MILLTLPTTVIPILNLILTIYSIDCHSMGGCDMCLNYTECTWCLPGSCGPKLANNASCQESMATCPSKSI